MKRRHKQSGWDLTQHLKDEEEAEEEKEKKKEDELNKKMRFAGNQIQARRWHYLTDPIRSERPNCVVHRAEGRIETVNGPQHPVNSHRQKGPA